LSPCFLAQPFFEYGFEFAELFQFENSALWAIRGNQTFLKILWFSTMVCGLALWPIAQNQIPCWGLYCRTKSCSIAHSK
jgi:hypothetical protein